MGIDRRALIGALGLGVAASAASAQETPAPAPPPQPELRERITTRAQENRCRLGYDGARFSGPAWDMLVAEGQGAHFFCIGEEHGIAENPRLAAQLFAAIGSEKACVEISPPMAAELDRAARRGVDGVRELFRDPGANVAFFGMREEVEWIAAARGAVRGRSQAVWGLDYEVGSDRRIISRLKAKRKPAAAATALAALEDASNQSWARYNETHSPQHIFSFAGDPTLARAVRDAWPNADDEAAWMLETLEETFAINQLWVSGQGWASNQRRAQFNRANLRRYFAEEGRTPKVMFKFGSSHMVRGMSHTQVLDIGTQVSELAESTGRKSFHVFVLPGAGALHAQFDPTAFTYRSAPAGAYADDAMTPLLAAAYADAMTLIDLRPIRPLVFGRRHKALDADLVRTIHGFDALLVMSGSTPSANL